VRPAEVQAEQGPLGGQGQGRATAVEPGTGYYGGGAAGLGEGSYGCDQAGQGCGAAGNAGNGGGGYGRGQEGQGRGADGNGGNGGGYGRGQGFRAGGGRGGAVGAGDGVGLDHPADTWITVSGTVVAFDGDLTVETGEGEMVIHMGATWYWDAKGIALDAGDKVEVRGFYDGDEFEAGWIRNATTGDEITMRDGTGRPLWAGRGRGGKRT
jgi:hypothetical protein